MTVEDIFKRLDAHIIKGIMLHEQFADYFDFLNFHGYKRLHEYRFLKESAELRGLHRYYTNHFEKLIPHSDVAAVREIPDNWFMYSRSDVSPSEKKRYVKDAFEKWVEWEKDTKHKYQGAYCELCELGEVAAACKIKDMVSHVDMELKKAMRMLINLKAIDFDLSTIYLCQDDIHEHYKEESEKIGIDIC